MVISHWVVVNKNGLYRDNVLIKNSGNLSPEQLYSDLQHSYPKFYKMDNLCKWAWVAAEYLLSANTVVYEGADLNKVAVVLATSHGCLDVDKRYLESIAIPSPSLFVYTLSNIMLGEVCIRHGFKGEQLCIANDRFDAREVHFAVGDLLRNNSMDSCLCGWVDVNGKDYDIFLFWATNKGKGYDFTPAVIDELCNSTAINSQP